MCACTPVGPKNTDKSWKMQPNRKIFYSNLYWTTTAATHIQCSINCLCSAIAHKADPPGCFHRQRFAAGPGSLFRLRIANWPPGGEWVAAAKRWDPAQSCGARVRDIVVCTHVGRREPWLVPAVAWTAAAKCEIGATYFEASFARRFAK